MASIKVLINLEKKNKKGDAPLYIRLIKNRRPKYMSLGIYLNPDYWDSTNQIVKKKHSNAARLNALITARVAEAQGVTADMETKNKHVSSYQLKEQILGKGPVEFFPYAHKYIDSLETAGKVNTHKRAKSIIKKMEDYLDKKPLYFHEITVSFLKDYENYLIKELKNRTNTVHANLRIIRKLFNDALREDLINHNENPFYKYKMKLEKTNKEYLTEEELKKIEDLELPKDQVINTHRNIYVFAAYAGGLRISDILTLKWENFDGSRINLKIQKTNTIHSIKLPVKALQIIKQYMPEKPNPKAFIFPLLDPDLDYSIPKVLVTAISGATAYTNKDLKAIAKKLEIFKKVSFHTSRHTFATSALRKGIRIEYVSKLLGHANIKETQIYAKIVNEELEKAMEVFNS